MVLLNVNNFTSLLSDLNVYVEENWEFFSFKPKWNLIITILRRTIPAGTDFSAMPFCKIFLS